MAAKYARGLPQLSSANKFLTEGGLETTLVYKKKIHLPEFCALALLDTPEGTNTLDGLYRAYVEIARRHGTGIVVETRTWRGSAIWAEKVGFSETRFMELNREAAQLLLRLRRDLETETTPIVISGCIGPLQDAYGNSSDKITVEQALKIYRQQVEVLAAAGVDMLAIMTVTSLNEAEAVVRLAREFQLPVQVSFGVEVDGHLLGGRSLEDAITEVDRRTDSYTTYFGVNCAHPSHIRPALRTMSEAVRRRIGSICGNSSSKSHDELDNSESLDRGDIPTFCDGNIEIAQLLPNVRVMGGCCGTDEEHIEALATRLVPSSHRGS